MLLFIKRAIITLEGGDEITLQREESSGRMLLSIQPAGAVVALNARDVGDLVRALDHFASEREREEWPG